MRKVCFLPTPLHACGSHSRERSPLDCPLSGPLDSPLCHYARKLRTSSQTFAKIPSRSQGGNTICTSLQRASALRPHERPEKKPTEHRRCASRPLADQKCRDDSWSLLEEVRRNQQWETDNAERQNGVVLAITLKAERYPQLAVSIYKLLSLHILQVCSRVRSCIFKCVRTRGMTCITTAPEMPPAVPEMPHRAWRSAAIPVRM